jgi:hypothetical protein
VILVAVIEYDMLSGEVFISGEKWRSMENCPGNHSNIPQKVVFRETRLSRESRVSVNVTCAMTSLFYG